MHRIFILCSFWLAPALLVGATRSWHDRPIAQWDQEDAKQVLAESPWVKYATPQPVRSLSPNECREAGDWNGCTGKGVGLAGTGLFGARREAEAIARAHALPHYQPVAVRWESSLPVRIAEQKAGETDVPPVDTDDYAIAVYDIPTPKRWNLARELKGVAFLKRDNKKDLKPSRVEISRHPDGTATIVYLFPGSMEISKRDGRLEFRAQIGRLFVSQDFHADQMQLEGKLELLLPPAGH